VKLHISRGMPPIGVAGRTRAYGIMRRAQSGVVSNAFCSRPRPFDNQTHRGFALDTIHALDRSDAQLMSVDGVQASASRRRVWSGVGSALAVLAVGLLAGCASTNYPAAPANLASGDYSYIIGAGDSLSIQVWRNPDLSMVRLPSLKSCLTNRR
jgi:hypothetical protein